MKETDLKVAGELKERLSRVVRLVDFRVFGSRARDEADAACDNASPGKGGCGGPAVVSNRPGSCST